MSEVSDLRKSGYLKEAWRLSTKLLSERPTDIWVARDFAWVIYDYMKCYSDSDSPGFKNIDAYVKSLAKARALPLGSDEAMFFDNAAKNVRFVVWELAKSGDKGLSDLKVLLNELVLWDPQSPIFIQGTVNGLLRGLQKDPDSIVKLMGWRGLDKFSVEDFEKREAGDRKIWSFAEEATHKYLKALSAKSSEGTLKYDEETLLQAANAAKALLSDVRCEDWEWPTKSLGELLRDMGRDDEAAAFLAPVVFAKPKEAWSWHAFASARKRADWDSYVKCLFQGLSVSRDSKMSIRLHEEAMQFFGDQNLKPLAKAEAELIDKCRRENGWPSLEAATRILQDFEQIEAASPKALRGEYRALSSNAALCLYDFVPKTEFYLEWMDANRKIAGIALRKKGIYTGWLKPKEPALSRKTVTYVSLISGEKPVVGEVYWGKLDERQRCVIGGVSPDKDSEIRRQVLREAVGILDLFENEETSQKYCFVRIPLDSSRNDDVYIPQALADSISNLAGKLVSVKERLVYVSKKIEGDKRDQPIEGEWKWKAFSVNPSDENGGSCSANAPQTQFYIDRVFSSGQRLSIATLSSKKASRGRYRPLAPVYSLEANTLNVHYAEFPLEEHHVYQGSIFGKTRLVLVGTAKEISSGELWSRTVKPQVTGIYKTSNGWGHIRCAEDVSIPPKLAQHLDIEPGSTVTARLYKTFVKPRRDVNSDHPRNETDGHWEWRAENLEVVFPPEQEVEGTVSIEMTGSGCLSTTKGLTCFIPTALVEECHLMEGDFIKAVIRGSWNRKKSETGLLVDRVLSIENYIQPSQSEFVSSIKDECDASPRE